MKHTLFDQIQPRPKYWGDYVVPVLRAIALLVIGTEVGIVLAHILVL